MIVIKTTVDSALIMLVTLVACCCPWQSCGCVTPSAACSRYCWEVLLVMIAKTIWMMMPNRVLVKCVCMSCLMS